ncbi:MAG: hypothetical protein P0Y53_01280 [Candidatus Pseudobacter hemicellulosilyticus]|uniref:Uncharacterized protein n=1 Tax=Candidatus Pseudobacter hemicellulosilyticus TaxID=3121375 RepID=A0AAJ5WTZ3_9BACT|nr:MAG: hypothetical protein P0Y53_01280 [Pseudobacter sp.]
MITYSNYPNLKYLSLDIPFDLSAVISAGHTKEAREFMRADPAIRKMYKSVQTLNSQGNRPKHYYLRSQEFAILLNDNSYCSKRRNQFLKRMPAHPRYGVICFLDYTYFTYWISGPAHPENKQVPITSMTVGLFRKDCLLSFEECSIQSRSINLNGNGFPGNTDVALRRESVRFATAVLGYLTNRQVTPVPSRINHTGERIWMTLNPDIYPLVKAPANKTKSNIDRKKNDH